MASDCLSRTYQLQMLTDWITAVTTDAHVILFTNDVVPSPTTVVGDLTAATFTGSATQVVVYGQPFLNDDGRLEVRCASTQFDWTAGASETVYGYAVLTDTTNLLIHARRLDEPVQMAGTLDSIIVDPGFEMSLITQS